MKEQYVLRVNNIKLSPGHSEGDMLCVVKRAIGLGKNCTITYEIAKKSIDNRHKPDIIFVYSVDVMRIVQDGREKSLEACAKKSRNKNVLYMARPIYEFPEVSHQDKHAQPVIIGFGPAGMFAALKLAEAGLCPIVFERGDSVMTRQKKVKAFWESGVLDTESNVQFGEGGAGTFSDGKLNTAIKDSTGRISHVLQTFVKFGAAPQILYVNKPHIGTDVLVDIVRNIRNYIKELGGEIYFNRKLSGLKIRDGRIFAAEIENTDTHEIFIQECQQICLAIGHSARDTFEMLLKAGLFMEPKPFAVGLRIEHPQSFINDNAYADACYHLPVADYKVTYQSDLTGRNRGVYSFCMCPGGYVVNASSEKDMTAVNGMSYAARDSANANSAMIVTVGPQDYGFGVLDGVLFQRKLERAAFIEGQGAVPVQLFSDFEHHILSSGFGRVEPCIKGRYAFANLRCVLPEFISMALIEGVHGCGRTIKGFDMEDAVFSGVESRTSSPVRIVRNEKMQSVSCEGLFLCGEGAGYAGGIMSAAVDGIKAAEKMVKR